MLRVGQKVVAVDVDGAHELRKGVVYTVSRIVNRFGRVGVNLLEVDPRAPFLAFKAERFRPVVDKPTDISVFKKMLAPSKRELVS